MSVAVQEQPTHYKQLKQISMFVPTAGTKTTDNALQVKGTRRVGAKPAGSIAHMLAGTLAKGVFRWIEPKCFFSFYTLGIFQLYLENQFAIYAKQYQIIL